MDGVLAATAERQGCRTHRVRRAAAGNDRRQPGIVFTRIILSEGKVNIFNLAKNAGTSVDQIERFYARNLPLSKEMARNLQSFGGALT